MKVHEFHMENGKAIQGLCDSGMSVDELELLWAVLGAKFEGCEKIHVSGRRVAILKDMMGRYGFDSNVRLSMNNSTLHELIDVMHTANPSERAELLAVFKHLVLQADADLTLTNAVGDTPLMGAVREGAAEIVRFLTIEIDPAKVQKYIHILNTSGQNVLTMCIIVLSGYFLEDDPRTAATLDSFKFCVRGGANVNHVVKHSNSVAAKLIGTMQHQDPEKKASASWKYKEAALRYLLLECDRRHEVDMTVRNTNWRGQRPPTLVEEVIGFNVANLEVQRIVLVAAAQREEEGDTGSGDPDNLLGLRPDSSTSRSKRDGRAYIGMGGLGEWLPLSDPCPSPPLLLGCRVTVRRVKSKPELNGKQGTLVKYIEGKKRWGVSVLGKASDGTTSEICQVSLRSLNFTRVLADAGCTAGPSDACVTSTQCVTCCRPGSRVVVVGLALMAELNGTPGVVVRYFPEKDRFEVCLLTTGKSVSLRIKNCQRDPHALESHVHALRHRQGAVVANPSALERGSPPVGNNAMYALLQQESEALRGVAGGVHGLSPCARNHLRVVAKLTTQQLDALYFPACIERWGNSAGAKHGANGTVGVPLRALLASDAAPCDGCGGDGEQYFCFCMNRAVNANKVEHCPYCHRCWYGKYGTRRCAYCKKREPDTGPYGTDKDDSCNVEASRWEYEDSGHDEYQAGLASEGYWGY